MGSQSNCEDKDQQRWSRDGWSRSLKSKVGVENVEDSLNDSPSRGVKRESESEYEYMNTVALKYKLVSFMLGVE